MFFIHTPAGFLMDAEAIASLTGHSIRTIRTHCTVAEYRGRHALYNKDHVAFMLNGVRTRRKKAA